MPDGASACRVPKPLTVKSVKLAPNTELRKELGELANISQYTSREVIG